jgi:hypothetical protein
MFRGTTSSLRTLVPFRNLQHYPRFYLIGEQEAKDYERPSDQTPYKPVRLAITVTQSPQLTTASAVKLELLNVRVSHRFGSAGQKP